MAVNEEIVTGRKFRKLIDEATKLWQRISFWTKACDVEFDDGMTAETKMGAMNGITSSLVAESNNIALSAAAGKILQDQITFLQQQIATLEAKMGDQVRYSVDGSTLNITPITDEADEETTEEGDE